MDIYQPLPVDFYQQDTLELAKSLIGCMLVHETTAGISAGAIVETEGYLGAADKAAHGFKYRHTKRTEVMFGAPGHAYTHTMHTHCLINVVSGAIGEPESVLIRALEPLTGIDLMLQRRPVNKLPLLTNGPGKLTKAMGISMAAYGHSFLQPPIWIAAPRVKPKITTGKRIGIDGSGEAKDYPYRFWAANHPFVSK